MLLLHKQFKVRDFSFLRKHFFLLLIFIIALAVRFYSFRESTYFGFDEARDAYASLEIYKNMNLKIVGPPANFPGLYHGPLYWYLIGPLYLIGNGDPYVVSAVFRVLNASGVFLIYLVATKFFNKRVGLISALIYAVSFEQSQYAMYYGHPSLGIFGFLIIFWGASLVLKDKKPKGLILMFVGMALAIQSELILAYTPFLLLILLFLTRRIIKRFSLRTWVTSFFASFIILSTFVLSELKYNFQSSKAIINLLKGGYSVMDPGDTRITLYLKMFSGLVHDNLVALENEELLIFVSLTIIFSLLAFSRKSYSIIFVLVWIFASSAILLLGGYQAYYVNVGVGLGLIIGAAFLSNWIIGRNWILGLSIISIILLSNLTQVVRLNKNSLIKEIKAQEGMKLSDELKILEKIYVYSSGRGFTVRVTSMPYKIQTTWAYLFETFGKKEWGYLPYWETELVPGHSGILPRPLKGTTCIRFLIREPARGIPEILIKNDIKEEDYFSEVIKEENIGKFSLQTREAYAKDCHDRVAE